MNELSKKTFSRFILKYRIVGEKDKTFWSDFRLFDTHKLALKQILEMAFEQCRGDASVKAKKQIKVEDVELISFSLIDSE